MRKYFYLFTLSFLSVNLYAQDNFKLKISGEAGRSLTLTLKDIAQMPHTTATIAGKDGKQHAYSGVPVSFMLDKVRDTAAKGSHGNLSKYLLVKCADGYKVLFSFAELDNSFTNKMVILADSMEGNPLPEARGPLRIVVTDEKKPARSCFQVTEMIVGDSKDE